MKLCIAGLENEIDFTDDRNTVFIIENRVLLGSMIKKLNDIVNKEIDLNEIVLIKDTENILPKANLIIDPFNIDINSKLLIKELYRRIEASFHIEECSQEFYTLACKLNLIIDDLLKEYNVDFEYQDELSLQSYLKLIDLKVVYSQNLSFYEQIIDYLELVSELFPNQPIIFFNLLSYLSDGQIKLLCDLKNYNHLYILFIENKDRQLDDFTKYIVDDDFYESIVNPI